VTKEKTKKEKSPKPKYNMAQNVWFMIKLAWTSGEKKVIALSLLSALTAVVLSLINLYVSPTILSVVERRASVSELIFTILAFLLALMFVSAASAYIDKNTIYGRISVRIELITLLNKKAATTSYPNLFEDKYQKLIAKSQKSINSNHAATEAVWITLTDIATNILGFSLYVFLLSSVQPVLIIVILMTTIISYYVSYRANEWRYHHREEEAEYEKQIYYLSSQARDLTAAKDIRIFGLRSWIEELYHKTMNAYMAFHQKAQSVYIWAKIADLILSFLRNGVAYAYLIGLVLNNGLSVAEFLLYFSAVGGFTAWVSGILSGFNTLHQQSLDISTVRESLEFDEPFKFEEGEALIAEAGRKYEICLENVSFRYPNAEKDTLSNINLRLHPGEKLAVVGLNGAGKTTLIKLICGFLDPTEGRVLLDGKDIRGYNRRDYYTMFSAVFQTFSLLAGTIATNVAQDNLDIDMDRVKECTKKAGLHDKIESLKDGYETYLNRQVFEEAILLSGGETQRLMLARALYKDAPFIVLDEPTAALDPIAESEIYQKYNEMTSGKSSIYISHRLASTRFCDRIILIADGGISEEGTHTELMKRGGKYAELYEVQSKYYKEGGTES
jgi:ATP-binding cassette subfamily B protein